VLRLAAALLAAAVATTPQPQVLFAVVDGPEKGLAIEPIAMVTKTPGPCAGCWRLRFVDPMDDDNMTQDDFAARYFRHGRTYRVLAGGGDAGTATVDEEVSLGCESLAASLMPPLPDYRGLAVGSMHVAPRKVVRDEPTAAEKKVLYRLARKAFRDKGVPSALFPDMEGLSLLSADLNHDGKRDLVGAFEAVGDKTKEYHDYHRLFLIAMADDAGGYRTEYVWYSRLAPGTNEARTETMTLVDTIDLDEDGTDEVIATTNYYESHDYVVLKRSPSGTWGIVYRGAGSGC
jgi:hypothetical protein